MTAQHCVTITIPSEAAYIRVIRLAVGAAAALTDLDVEAIEDLRIGVDELSSTLMEVSDGSDLRFELRPRTERGLRIDAWATRDGDEVDRERFGFSQRILTVIADEHGFDLDGPTAHAWLVRGTEPDRP